MSIKEFEVRIFDLRRAIWTTLIESLFKHYAIIWFRSFISRIRDRNRVFDRMNLTKLDLMLFLLVAPGDCFWRRIDNKPGSPTPTCSETVDCEVWCLFLFRASNKLERFWYCKSGYCGCVIFTKLHPTSSQSYQVVGILSE